MCSQRTDDEALKEIHEIAAACNVDIEKMKKMIQEINEHTFNDNQMKREEAENRLRECLKKLDKERKDRAEALIRQMEEKRERIYKAWLEEQAKKKREHEAYLKRLAEQEAKEKRERDEAKRRKLMREREEANRKRKEAAEKEARRQREIKNRGVCCMNFPWIHEGNGKYRCLGRGHTMQFND